MEKETHDLIRTVPVEEVHDGKITYVERDGKHFLLTRVGDEIKAYRNLCKHQFLVMEDCELDQDSFMCPYHTVRYYFANGEVKDDSGFMGIEPLTSYATFIVHGVVHLEVPPGERW